MMEWVQREVEEVETSERWNRLFDSIGRTEDGDGDIFSTEKDDCYKQSHKKSA